MAGDVKLGRVEVGVMSLVSLLMIASSWFHWWGMAMMEVLGFVTGGVCVWLVVRQHLWNWPIGLANNVVFFVLFWQSRLFADMGLQVVYFGLGIYGWYQWLYGGANRTELKVTSMTKTEWVVFAIFIPLGTWGLRELLIVVNGAAPFWDSFTTILSLSAQYLLCRKRFENWFFWILADIIYVPLYFSRDLPLTGILYGVLLCMCLVGMKEWQTSRNKMEAATE